MRAASARVAGGVAQDERRFDDERAARALVRFDEHAVGRLVGARMHEARAQRPQAGAVERAEQRRAAARRDRRGRRVRPARARARIAAASVGEGQAQLVLRDRHLLVGRRRPFVERAIGRVGDGDVEASRRRRRSAARRSPSTTLTRAPMPLSSALRRASVRQPRLQLDQRRRAPPASRDSRPSPTTPQPAQKSTTRANGGAHEVDEQQRIDREAIAGARLPQRRAARAGSGRASARSSPVRTSRLPPTARSG